MAIDAFSLIFCMLIFLVMGKQVDDRVLIDDFSDDFGWFS